MNKFNKIILVAVVIVLYSIAFFAGKIQKPVVYKFDIIDQDLKLTNYNIVKFNNYYYVPETYSIEKIDTTKNITNLSFLVYNEDELITDFVFDFPNSPKINAPIGVVKNNSKISDKTTLTIKFKYNLNGIDKEAYQSIELKNHKVSFED